MESKDNSPTKTGNWSHHEMAKIEEKNPEMLAKKIIEQGRNLEKSKSSEGIPIVSPRSIHSSHVTPQTGSVEVRKVENIDVHGNKVNRSPLSLQQSSAQNISSLHNSLQQQSSLHHQDVYNQDRSVPSQLISGQSRDQSIECNAHISDKKSPRTAIVDLPKVDLKLSINNTSFDPMANSIAAAMSSAGRHPPSLSQTQKDPPLVLPPHPNSRSHSSEGHTGEDMTFASTKGNFYRYVLDDT